MDYRHMRLMVIFDLPVMTKVDKRAYTRFHNLLLDDGFQMLQYSIYVRFCNNEVSAKKHITRIRVKSPSTGNVRIIEITESQYENMILVVGKKTSMESIDESSMLVVIE